MTINSSDCEEKVGLLNWVTYEHLGSPIFDYNKGKESYEKGNLFRDAKVGQPTDLTVGQDLMVPTITGYVKTQVLSINIAENTAIAGREGGTLYFLKFQFGGTILPTCWICYGSGNPNAISHLTLKV